MCDEMSPAPAPVRVPVAQVVRRVAHAKGIRQLRLAALQAAHSVTLQGRHLLPLLHSVVAHAPAGGRMESQVDIRITEARCRALQVISSLCRAALGVFRELICNAHEAQHPKWQPTCRRGTWRSSSQAAVAEAPPPCCRHCLLARLLLLPAQGSHRHPAAAAPRAAVRSNRRPKGCRWDLQGRPRHRLQLLKGTLHRQ